ncbi:MAG TPA: hypothetical protein VKX45_18330 [Bryobacteraceae bacterium]|jgi:hypothetical protein|nr:hypothetical protein [Bryobacteraceae bacterium]
MRFALLCLTFAACSGFAQGPGDPPPILEIVQRPGSLRTPAKPYAETGAAINVIGMSAVTGLPQEWFLENHFTYASVEDLDRAINAPGALHPIAEGEPARTLIATWQPQWSYHPEEAARLFPQARYFNITIYRLANGTEAGFAKLAALRRANLETRNLNRPDIAYEVISGAPSGMYLFVAPIVTLRSADEGTPNTPQYALGLADARAEVNNNTAPADISREHLLFRVEPRLSYVSDDFAAGQEAFWRGK